jgi:hypothetical protein
MHICYVPSYFSTNNMGDPQGDELGQINTNDIKE